MEENETILCSYNRACSRFFRQKREEYKISREEISLGIMSQNGLAQLESENGRVRWSKLNGDILIVSDQVVQWGLYASEPYLYYKNSEHNVYRVNTYTMESKKLAKNVEGNILLSVDGSTLFRKFTDKAGASHWEKIN